MKTGCGITLSYAASLLLQGIYDDDDDEGGETGDHATMNGGGGGGGRQWGATLCAARKRRKRRRRRSAFGCGGNRALPTGKVVPSRSRQTDRHPFPEAL